MQEIRIEILVCNLDKKCLGTNVFKHLSHNLPVLFRLQEDVFQLLRERAKIFL